MLGYLFIFECFLNSLRNLNLENVLCAYLLKLGEFTINRITIYLEISYLYARIGISKTRNTFEETKQYKLVL